MRVLLTGSGGYVGAVVRPALVAAGHEVVGLDSGFFEGCDFLHEPPPAELRLDLRAVEEEHVGGFEAVVHLAALSNDPIGDLDADLTYEINHQATVRLATLARARGVKHFVFASSCSMYGASGADHGIDELAPLAPLTAYAESKARSERSLADLGTDDFSPVFLRFGTAFGASPRLRLDVVLNNLVGWAVTTGAVRLQSDGMSWRPLIHVQDMAHAIVEVIGAPRELSHCQAFNVGSTGANYRIRDLATMVAEAVGETDVEFAAGAGADARSYRVDFSKIADRLPGFRPSWDASRGVDELLEAYRMAGMDRAMFEGDRFVRLARLRTLIDSGRLETDLHWRAPLAVSSV